MSEGNWRMGLGSIKSPAGKTDVSVPKASGFSVPRLGLAVFQNDANPTNGVAALDGQRVRPFESRTALPSDCIWISTAKSGDVAQNFRPKNFLRSTLDALADDLGVELRDIVDGMPKMARMLHQVGQIAAACYEWEDARAAWAKPTLPEVLREAIARQPDPKYALIAPLKDALQTYSAVPDRVVVRDHSRPMRQYTLRHNRLEYAQYLLSQPYPDVAAEWLLLEGRDAEQVLQIDAPCLVEVMLEFDVGPSGIDYSRLAAFGSSVAGRRGGGAMRRWVTQVELAWLVRYAHVHVQNILMCAAPPKALPSEYHLPAALRSDPLLALNLAAGVVAECHWVALTLGRLKKREHTGASSRFEEVFSPISVWLRAYDRAYGFFMAEQAAKAGYEVVGYGYGAVTVESDRNEPEKLLALADQLGVCHPNLVALQSRLALGGQEVETEV